MLQQFALDTSFNLSALITGIRFLSAISAASASSMKSITINILQNSTWCVNRWFQLREKAKESSPTKEISSFSKMVDAILHVLRKLIQCYFFLSILFTVAALW